MPPASSPGMPGDRPSYGPYRPLRPLSERAARIRFRRAVTLMLMTLLVPGSAQLMVGNRRIGRLASWTWLAVLGSGLFTLLLALVWREVAYALVSNTFWLGLIRLLLMLLAIGWFLLFIDAWRLGQPLTLRQGQRLGLTGLNGVLCFAVAGSLLFGAHLVGVQQHFISTMFGDGVASNPNDGRYNVLLLGGDSGKGRFGLRPDSINIASIDEETGRTVLFGLPRNMEHFPFAEGSPMAKRFPHGFNCEDCYLNSVMTWADDNPKVAGAGEDAPVNAEISAVEGITGLKINYWAMVNLRGFQELVDAVGGVTLTVRDPIPIGLPHDDFYSHIQPGRKKLDGWETLWYARARYDSDDYSRMARQKCVMAAMLHQIDPQTMVTKFEAISKATQGMVETDLPASELGRFIDLAMKAKSQKISTVSFVPPMIDTAKPDVDLIHAKVGSAIEKSAGSSAGDDGGGGKPKKKKEATTTQGGSIGSLSEGYAANQAADLGSAC